MLEFLLLRILFFVALVIPVICNTADASPVRSLLSSLKMMTLYLAVWALLF